MLDNNENYNEESKNKRIDRLMFFSSLAGCDEDVPDYLIISSTLRQGNPNAIKNLIDIYVRKCVTEGGLETYNLFSLYLLLYLIYFLCLLFFYSFDLLSFLIIHHMFL